MIQKRSRLLFFILIALLVLILRLPSLEEPFDNDSSAIAYSARLITRGEPLYSTHHPGHHLPGAYYTYALAFSLLGDHTASVKIFLIPWLIVTAWTVYGVGETLHDDRTGVTAALIFSLLSSHVFLKGNTAEPELFAMLPFTLTVLLTMRSIQSSAGWKTFFWTGAVSALAFLFKAVFLASFGIAVSFILLDLWRGRRQKRAVWLAVERGLGLAAGFAVVFGLTVGYFASQGLLERFGMVFSLGSTYIGSQAAPLPAYFIVIIPIYLLAANNIFLMVFSLAGSLRLWRKFRQEGGLAAPKGITALGILIWFVLSILMAGITRVGYVHYGLTVVPALSVVAGWELGQLSLLMPSADETWKRRLGQFGFLVVVLLTLTSSALSNWNYYSYYVQYKAGWINYEGFLTKGSPDGAVYLRTKNLADYITARTSPDDRIFHWTEFPLIYYYADRKAPVDMIWTIQVESARLYPHIFAPQTKYIVLGPYIFLEEPDWMQVELDKAYQLETVIDEQRVYRRVEP